jgi:hypothetical protein
MSDILLDNTNVVGHIYLIKNTKLNKLYVGQTLSHRKNKGKYRSFGFQGRFNDHVSEAICNTKKKQCTYLNNAIRLYGKDTFSVTLITTCSPSELDNLEQLYIKEYNTLYPNGYNLTVGGKTFKNNLNTDFIQTTTNPPKKRGGCNERTAETRAKMTKSLKEICGTPEARREQMMRSQTQHTLKKIEKFQGVKIDLDAIDSYIRTRNSKDGSKYIKVCIEGKTTTFVGKYEKLEDLRIKAINFIKNIKSATLPN